MIVSEVIQQLMELDPKSDILFTKRSDSDYIYVVAKLPDGRPVAAEMPTGVEKEKQ
jgi:hypothetical protein